MRKTLNILDKIKYDPLQIHHKPTMYILVYNYTTHKLLTVSIFWNNIESFAEAFGNFPKQFGK